MDTLTPQQYELIARHLSGESTSAEEKALADWLQENPGNELVLKQLRGVWAATEPANTFSPAADPAWEKVSKRLNLASEVATPAASEIKVIPFSPVRTFMRVTAVLLSLLVFGYLIKRVWFANPAETVLSAGNVKQDFYLPDSSRIWLKPNTTLTYTTDYDDETREVKLTGEAFFEVRKNPAKPFIVHAQHTQVKVLGTSFLVKTTKASAADEVEVITGKVAVAATHKKAEKTVLLPGQKAMVSQNGTLTQLQAQNPNTLAWQTEQLTFANTPLAEVATTLEEYFGVQVTLSDSSLTNCRFTGTFTQPQLTEVLQVLSAATGLQYTNQNATYSLSGQGCAIP